MAPEGQVPAVQFGWAVNEVLLPTPTVMEVGEMLTEERTPTAAVIVMVALANLVIPFRNAFTVSRTEPGAGPAVKVVVDPVVGVALPKLLFTVQM